MRADTTIPKAFSWMEHHAEAEDSRGYIDAYFERLPQFSVSLCCVRLDQSIGDVLLFACIQLGIRPLSTQESRYRWLITMKGLEGQIGQDLPFTFVFFNASKHTRNNTVQERLRRVLSRNPSSKKGALSAPFRAWQGEFSRECSSFFCEIWTLPSPDLKRP